MWNYFFSASVHCALVGKLVYVDHVPRTLKRLYTSQTYYDNTVINTPKLPLTPSLNCKFITLLLFRWLSLVVMLLVASTKLLNVELG